MQTKYSKQFKIESVRKVLARGPDVSISSVARSLGLNITTLHGWLMAINKKKIGEPPTSGGTREKSPYHWSVKEKFEAIINTSNLSEEELGEYCRKQGIFPHHLETWKAEFMASQDSSKIDSNSEIRQLKNEVKSLTIELNRKEKALAETAALLVLKKKVHDLWGNNEGD